MDHNVAEMVRYPRPPEDEHGILIRDASEARSLMRRLP
jgi:hypothetical protein